MWFNGEIDEPLLLEHRNSTLEVDPIPPFNYTNSVGITDRTKAKLKGMNFIDYLHYFSLI